MSLKTPSWPVAVVAVLIFAASGCERDTSGLDPVPPNTDPVVFADGLAPGLDFQAFLGSKLDAVDIDSVERFAGTASAKVTVPGPGDLSGGYAGGAVTTNLTRDLSGYDALTFWAKASMAATLDVAGLGNDNTGTSRFTASRENLALTTAWQKYVIPIPLPEKLSSERGLFYFAEGAENGQGYTIWFDEVQFETVGTISNPRPVLQTQNVGAFVGATVVPSGARTVFDVDGTDRTIDHLAGYFTFISNNEEVAIFEDGDIKVVGAGNAILTARLGNVDAAGSLILRTTAAPTVAAPTPPHPSGDVISLFSNAYSNRTVDTWSTPWDVADVSDFLVESDDIKAYTNLVFAGIEFAVQTVDASGMTHFHMDIWIPDGTVFRVKLVDFGDDGIFSGDPDSEHEYAIGTTSEPPLLIGEWFSLDIPLSEFTGLASTEHLAQMILGGDAPTVFVDNIYFHK